MALDLRYNSPQTGTSLGGAALFNGNIIQMMWASTSSAPEQTGSTPAQAGYGFTYDGLNRLRSAAYADGTGYTSNAGRYSTAYTYDANGNMSTLTRNLDGNQVDNLGYTYLSGGNRLGSVSDGTASPLGYKAVTGNYTYDNNGNMTYDVSKGFSITYNTLNLPQLVSMASDYARYTYDAAGIKLAKTVTNGTASTVRTDYSGPFMYENSVLKCIDPDGDIVIFINGFSYGGEGGTRSYWQKTETQTQSVRYTDGFGHNLWSGNERHEVVTSDFAKSFCEKFGEDVTKAKFFDGAPLNSTNYGFRNAVGYLKGMFNVEQIIHGLAKTGGVITEPLIIATHSMGGAYGRGFLDAIMEYIKEHPRECRGLSISVYDFDPYQAKYMKEVYGVSITQIIHKGTVAEQEEQGTEEDGGTTKYINDTENSKSHTIASFLKSFGKLESGTYVWNGTNWVKK